MEQVLGHVRDESTGYEMCQMLSDMVRSCVQSIVDAVPKGWVSELQGAHNWINAELIRSGKCRHPR